MFKRTFAVLTILALFGALPLMAGDKKVETKASTDKMMKAEHVDLEGTLVCLGCSLKKAEGARASCKTTGHKHALQTADGKYVNFLENQYSADLIGGGKYHNKKMQVHGMYYASADMLDVEAFTVDGSKKGWCGRCNSMDGCAYAKGSK